MNKEFSRVIKEAQDIIRRAPQKLLFLKVADANDMLRTGGLRPSETGEIVDYLNDFVLWMSGDDEIYRTENTYSLVKTSYGPRIMTQRDWKRYQTAHSPKKRRPRGDSF